MDDFLRQRLYDIYAAFAAGRIDDALREFDDNVVMTSYAPVEVFPALGRRQGKAAVATTMQAMHAAFEHLSYTPVFMVVENDSAAVIVLAKLRQRATDRIIQLVRRAFPAPGKRPHRRAARIHGFLRRRAAGARAGDCSVGAAGEEGGGSTPSLSAHDTGLDLCIIR